MAIAKIETGNGGGGAEESALEGRHKVGQQLGIDSRANFSPEIHPLSLSGICDIARRSFLIENMLAVGEKHKGRSRSWPLESSATRGDQLPVRAWVFTFRSRREALDAARL
jgi:hypothetical protein